MILSNIHSPEDIKSLSYAELLRLAREMRSVIIETVASNGGHLASNLGVVELTLALHRTFDSPEDAIIFDVGHQCYAHKLLTDRYDRFATLRQASGISGFTRKKESIHDYFDSGHASVSISQALGLLVGQELVQGMNSECEKAKNKTSGGQASVAPSPPAAPSPPCAHKGAESEAQNNAPLMHRKGKVIAVIGDGALTGGMAYEGLSHAGQLARELIVVLNDNQMSIDHNTGAVSRYLSRMTATSGYQTIRHKIDRMIDRIPYFGRHLEKLVFHIKRAMKGLLFTNNLFVDLGFEYVGPLDGHDEKTMEEVFRRVRTMDYPTVVHVVTKKGKGYRPAEDRPEEFHGVGPFCIWDGTVEKYDKLSFTQAFSAIIDEMAAEHNDIAAVTAAMAKGTGLAAFERHYPKRFFDVGIAEEHAVTFAGGIARSGAVPFVCIYSTFVQRAVDSVIHDVALQGAHVILVLDRAGAVPNDGETHQGLFDIALFRPVPGLTIMSPASAADLRECIKWAYNAAGPIVIRYPKCTCPTEREPFSLPVEAGRGVLIRAALFAPALDAMLEENSALQGRKKVLFVCTGGMYSECVNAARSLLMQDVIGDIYTLRFIKPFDEDYFFKTVSNMGYDAVLIAEDGVRTGGIAMELQMLLMQKFPKIRCIIKTFGDRFMPQGTRDEIYEDAKLSAHYLSEAALRQVLSSCECN